MSPGENSRTKYSMLGFFKTVWFRLYDNNYIQHSYGMTTFLVSFSLHARHPDKQFVDCDWEQQ